MAATTVEKRIFARESEYVGLVAAEGVVDEVEKRVRATKYR